MKKMAISKYSLAIAGHEGADSQYSFEGNDLAWTTVLDQFCQHPILSMPNGILVIDLGIKTGSRSA